MDNLSHWFTCYSMAQTMDEAWGIHVLAVGASHARPKPSAKPEQSFGSPAQGLFRYRGDAMRIPRDFHLVFLARGRGQLVCDGGYSSALRSGDLMVLAPGLGHRYRFEAASDWQEYWILFNGPWAARLRDKGILSAKQPVLPIAEPALLVQRFLAIHRHLRAREARVAAGELMALLGLATGQRAQARRPLDSFEQELEKILRALSETPHDRVDLRAVAATTGISYAHFRRIFKGRLGMSPHQYHLLALVHRAKELLGDGSRGVHEVAEALGFDDPYYFSRIFKQKTGVAPSRWVGP